MSEPKSIECRRVILRILGERGGVLIDELFVAVRQSLPKIPRGHFDRERSQLKIDGLVEVRPEKEARKDVLTLTDAGVEALARAPSLPAFPPGTVEDRVVRAYEGTVAARGGDILVPLGEIRRALGDVGRDGLDAALRAVHGRAAGLGLCPMTVRSKLTPELVADACDLDGREMHFLRAGG